MSEQKDARHLLEWAEQAATAGDFGSADELLRDAARIQEQELGPQHPDLANTLNNLAIVAERTERWSEAETFYRRAAAIAAAALPADHPMAVESRQNLEDFCRTRGLPLDPLADSPFRSEHAVITPKVGQPPPAAARPRPKRPATIAPDSTPAKAALSFQWIATGAVILVVAVLLLWRPWSSRETSSTAATPESAVATPAAAAPPPTVAPAAAPAPVEKPAPPPAPPRDDRKIPAKKATATGGITVGTAQVCRNFSASGGNWRCEPVGETTAPGSMVFYTRIRSARNTSVVHRWYRGSVLRQSVTLDILASPTEGYRTYSRLTMDAGDWRLEVRDEDGDLLHEQRFVVR